jgi:glycosyltransferase involved in cell wall biosynthesis
MPPLLVLAPIEPCATGNGLAMRVASFVGGAASRYDVRVAVVPVAGALPSCPAPISAPVIVVPFPGRAEVRTNFAQLLNDPTWRQLLADADPMPLPATLASPALAPEVIRATGVQPGTSVHVVRSYLAPLGLAVAEALSSPWTSLDLDDDDEGLATAQGDAALASSFHRLVELFAPRFSAVCLASADEAVVVGRRHELRTIALPNAFDLPAETYRRTEESATLLFVGNLAYGPNVEAAVLLVEQVLPGLQVRAGRPVKVMLVGSYPPGGPIDHLASNPSVTLTGYVDDLSPYYAEAGAVVAPFISGSGTRIKLLEAFAHQVPVVTTPIGAAGLSVRHTEHLLLAESTESLIEATAAVLEDPDHSRAMTDAALAYVSLHHSTTVVTEQVLRFLEAAAEAGGVS